MKKKGKEIKMLSKAACAFSTGELRLFSLWFKTKSNKTLYQMVYKKQACTLQRSHTRKINLFLTLCHEFLGPLHTTDTDSIPTQVEKTWREEFCTHGHLLAQKNMASGRKTQAFIPPTQKKKINKPCSSKLLSNFPVGFKVGWGLCVQVGYLQGSTVGRRYPAPPGQRQCRNEQRAAKSHHFRG